MSSSDPSGRRPATPPLAPRPVARGQPAPPPADEHTEPQDERTMLVRGSPFQKLVAEAKAAPIAPPPPSTLPAIAAVKAWRPYRWNLPKVSKASALLARRLEWLVPSGVGLAKVKQTLLERFEVLLEEPVSVSVDAISVISPRELKRFLGAPSAFGVLAPLPQKTRGLLEVELGLAHALIDKLLGGTGEDLALRPLTEIEDGVMSYILLEALKELAPYVEPGLPRLKLESMISSPEEAAKLLEGEEQLAVVQLRGVLGAHSGHVRLFVPGSVLGMVAPSPAGREYRARRVTETKAHLDRLSRVKTWLRAEIGRGELSSRDLEHLRVKDVVLVDGLTVRPDKGEGGTAILRVGRGRLGRIQATVACVDGRYRLKLGAFLKGEEARHAAEPEPAVAAAPPARTQPPDEASSEIVTDSGVPDTEGRAVPETVEGADLLNDIPLQISVELGRIAVTAEEVVALKVGQVIELSRVPGEPVELSVNGRVVARGEVVEVEGHLGVRITSLAG